ncbi:UNVERIFIED_CONTAM: hypothetical protein HDU68_008027 [Siphonaria sp. JEL0065]|nr:hypothetical protein HDU68_008027 [Siphonaria sp. JEL0065]
MLGNTFMDMAPGSFNGQGYDSAMLDWFAQEVGRVGGILELSMQPNASLSTFTSDMYEKLATQLLEINTKYGLPVFLRYGHEMNGDWNFYGNQPTAYKASFRAMALAVRAKTNMTAMVWAPNIGITYPFRGGGFVESPNPGGLDFRVLDTNQDGKIDNNDDPYTPFYPGDDVVDWVGVSLYNYPFPGCFNCAVEPTYFNDYLTGQGPVAEKGAIVTAAYTAVHNFYQMFCSKESHNKPLMIPETGSPWFLEYANMAGAQSETVVKSGWWNQLLSASTMAKFPKMKLVVNFEETKPGWPLGTEVSQNWKVANTTSQISMFTGLLNTYMPTLLQSKDLVYSCDGKVLQI